MRLLVVEHKKVWGGGQVMLLNLLQAWRRAGEPIEPTIVCPPDAALLARARENGIECIPLVLGEIEKTRGLGWNLAQRVGPTQHMLQIMRRMKTDVVLANSAYSFLACVLAAKLARVPVVWWEHNSTLPEGAMLRRMLGLADHIAVVSAEIRAQFVAMAPQVDNKLAVIHNGIDAEKFCPARRWRETIRRELAWDESKTVVGTVTRLAPEKGTETFVRAANEIARANANARFLVVGDGPERAVLEQLANREAIRFVGMQENVAAWLNAMDLFVLSSPAEAFPLAVLEAMACGVPVVASNVGGIPEMVKDGLAGLLVQPNDVSELSQVVIALLDDGALRRAMGDAGRDRVQREFLLEQSARKMRELFVSAARAGPTGRGN